MRFFEGTLAVAYLLLVSGARYCTCTAVPCTADVGECKALDDCPEIQQVILKEIMKGTYIMDLLRNTSCGIVGMKPYFCCPFPAKTSSDVITPMEHQNLQLLPRHICGYDFSDRILGGKDARLKQFPWMALLQIEEDTGPRIICGGSLINENYVLSAAHCINNDDQMKRTSVCLGEHNIMTDPDCEGILCGDLLQTFEIDEFIRHPTYNKKKKLGDMALIRLNKKVVFTEYAIPICLPFLDSLNRNYLERNLIVAGWGATEIDISSDVKQWLKVPVVHNNRCAETLDVVMDNTMMCAGSVNGESSCIGDSGGPLMMHEHVIPYRPGEQWVIVAVVQGGSLLCGTKDVPGLYTRVFPYINWILDNIKP